MTDANIYICGMVIVKICIFHNEYHCIWKTTVQVTLIIRTDISCDCLSVDTSGDILSHLRYEHWFQLVYVNTICFLIQINLLTVITALYCHKVICSHYKRNGSEMQTAHQLIPLPILKPWHIFF